MPGFDWNGPIGAGPMTGGGRGVCRNANTGYGIGAIGMRRGHKRGFRGGRGACIRQGFGPGFGQPFASDMVEPTPDIHVLKSRANSMKRSLDKIGSRIESLEKNAVNLSGSGKEDF